MALLASSYSVYLFVLVGFVFGFVILYFNKDYFFVSGTPSLIFRCLLFSVLNVLSVLLFAVFEQLISGNAVHFGAVSTYGMYLICPLFIFLLFRKNHREIFDSLAVYVLPSLFLQRIRCFFSGCCYGKLIGINIFNTDIYRWPTRESEMVFYIVMLLFFIKEKKHNNIKTGAMFPLLMICYGAFRFVGEFFREGAGIIHIAHLWSVLTVIIGASIYVEYKKKRSTTY